MRGTPTSERRQRLIALLLLAFCIDAIRPLVDPATHQHAGGERVHVHAGGVNGGFGHTLLFGAGIKPERPARGLHSLPASEQAPRHTHLYRTLQVAHVASAPALPVVTAQLPACVPAFEGARPAATRPCSARAPPTLPA